MGLATRAILPATGPRAQVDSIRICKPADAATSLRFPSPDSPATAGLPEAALIRGLLGRCIPAREAVRDITVRSAPIPWRTYSR
jgi:hypothetical protein